MIYSLPDGVRVFRSGDEIRFRRGVWSHTEAIIRLAGQEEELRRLVGSICDALARDRQVDLASLANGENFERCQGLLDGLTAQRFLEDESQSVVARAITSILGGTLGGFENQAAPPRPVLFFSDSEYARKAARALAEEMALPLDVLDDATMHTLSTADLTTKSDAVGHMETLATLERKFRGYVCVAGCVGEPNLSMLRNLNRLLIEAEKPLILGLVDGPFISALSMFASESGCFECFEQRLLARLEDTVVYHDFVRSTNGDMARAGKRLAPQLHTLAGVVIAEAYLYATLSMLRLAGRIVNVYLPLLEIQVQDLLRVPYCPACGFISKAQMNEMYTSSKRIVSEMLEKVEVQS